MFEEARYSSRRLENAAGTTAKRKKTNVPAGKSLSYEELTKSDGEVQPETPLC